MTKALLNVFLLKEKQWIFFAALIIAQIVALGDMENAMSSSLYSQDRFFNIVFIAELPVFINFPLIVVCGLIINRYYELFSSARFITITILTLYIALMAESSLPTRVIHSLGLFQYVLWLTIISVSMLYLTKGDKPAFESTTYSPNVIKVEPVKNFADFVPASDSPSGKKDLLVIAAVIIGILGLIYFGKKADEYNQAIEESADNAATYKAVPDSKSEAANVEPALPVPEVTEQRANRFPTKAETDEMVAQRLKELDEARLQSNDVAAAAIARSAQMAEIVAPPQPGRKLGDKYCLNNVMRIVTKDDPAALISLPDGSYESCAE